MEITNHKIAYRVKLLLAIFLVVLACGLVVNRMLPKNFTSFLPSPNTVINACIIIDVGNEAIELDENSLIEFLSILKDIEYYSNGYYDNILVGNLYYVQFLGEHNGSQSLILTMIISDENIAYIGNKQYNMRSKSISIADFLRR